MKRSRIFLGPTTACLAIAGIVAANYARFGNSRFYYYTLARNIRCVPGGFSTVLFDPNSTTAWSYSTISDSGNIIPAYYTATCKRPLTYFTD